MNLKPRAIKSSRQTTTDGGRKNPPKPGRHSWALKQTKDVFIYGRHAIQAALANQERIPLRLYATEQASGSMKSPIDLTVEIVEAGWLDRLVGAETPHQGLVLKAKPLPKIDLSHFLRNRPQAHPLLALDQITDPRNLGAVMRAALAFDTAAILMPERNSAALNGACARAAAGAMDGLPIIKIGNLARSLELIKEQGYWVVGLDGKATKTIADLPAIERLCLVLGAEDQGMRQLTRDRCDHLVRLPVSSKVESLNVAVAAGIALYTVHRQSS